jgi:hypothetical protein
MLRVQSKNDYSMFGLLFLLRCGDGYGGDTLEIDVILLEGLFEFLRTFIVEDMEGWCVSVRL